MTSRHFTPKTASSKSVHFDIASYTGRVHNQFTSKSRHDMLSKSEQRNEELMMTVRRNQAGDTEIKFPIGDSRLIHDTQKLINRYFVSDDSEDISSTICKERLPEYPKLENTPVISHSTNNDKNAKSNSRQMINPSNVQKRKKPVENFDKSINLHKSTIKEEPTTTQNVVVDRKMVHLVGYVEHVIRWDQILKNVQINVLYNVLGTFLNIINGTHPMEKYVFIKGNNGTVLECSFFEVDRPFPPITRGQFVGCFGHIIGPQKLRLYNVQLLEESERNETQRAIYLSQRITHELNNRKSS